MTEEELRGKIAALFLEYSVAILGNNKYPDVFNLADKILALTEQYYREAGYKSPHEVKSLVFNAILHADDKQKEAIRAGYKNCNQCDATNVKKEGPPMDEPLGTP